MRETVVIFVKAPQAGRVKTRLGQDIGAARAASIFRLIMNKTIFEAQKGRWRTALAIEPGWAAHAPGARFWPRTLARMAQSKGDLGARMNAVFNSVDAGPLVIIGADAPALRARHLRAAFAALRASDAVFGPAADGGYWLIGLARRKRAPSLFKDVRWSSAHALDDTLKTLPENFDVSFLETLTDVDRADDLGAMAPGRARPSGA